MSDRERLKHIINDKAFIYNADKKFKLASGEESNHFFDLKTVLLDPEGIGLIARCIFEKIKNTGVQYVGGLEIGSIPIAAALCQLSWQEKHPIFGFFVRKEKKERGTEKKIEGNLVRDKKVIILDDVITKGNSVLSAIDAVRSLNCTVEIIIPIIDREEGASSKFKEMGIKFDPLFRKREFNGLSKVEKVDERK